MTVKKFFESNPDVKVFVFDGYTDYTRMETYALIDLKNVLNAEIKDIIVKGDDKRIQRWARNSITLFI